jgi:multiple sugar transport system permease protein
MNTISAILFSTWQATGAALLLFMVGLQGVPTETLEAAGIDGANGPQRFWHIILPQLRPISIVVIGTTIANSLRGFDFLQVLTQGGPARSSETLALSSYFDTFLLQEPNLGAAVSIVLTIVVLAASWIYLRRQQVRV